MQGVQTIEPWFPRPDADRSVGGCAPLLRGLRAGAVVPRRRERRTGSELQTVACTRRHRPNLRHYLRGGEVQPRPAGEAAAPGGSAPLRARLRSHGTTLGQILCFNI